MVFRNGKFLRSGVPQRILKNKRTKIIVVENSLIFYIYVIDANFKKVFFTCGAFEEDLGENLFLLILLYYSELRLL